MKPTLEQLMKAEEKRLAGLLRFRSSHLPEFQIPSELPSIIPTESKTPEWVKHLSEKDSQELAAAQKIEKKKQSQHHQVCGQPTQFRQKLWRKFRRD